MNSAAKPGPAAPRVSLARLTLPAYSAAGFRIERARAGKLGGLGRLGGLTLLAHSAAGLTPHTHTQRTPRGAGRSARGCRRAVPPPPPRSIPPQGRPGPFHGARCRGTPRAALAALDEAQVAGTEPRSTVPALYQGMCNKSCIPPALGLAHCAEEISATSWCNAKSPHRPAFRPLAGSNAPPPAAPRPPPPPPPAAAPPRSRLRCPCRREVGVVSC